MILKSNRRSFSIARRILKNGGTVAIPTETFYGLCAKATDKRSVEAVIRLKGRGKEKGIPILVRSSQQMLDLVKRPNALTLLAMKHFWPGPLSLIFENKKLPRIVEGSKKSIMARVSSSKVLSSILKGLPFPLTGTSANISGRPSARSASCVKRYFGDMIDLVIDAGRLTSKRPSTILDLRKRPKILRQGKISRQTIDEFIKNGLNKRYDDMA